MTENGSRIRTKNWRRKEDSLEEFFPLGWVTNLFNFAEIELMSWTALWKDEVQTEFSLFSFYFTRQRLSTEIVLIIMEIHARKTVTASTIWTPLSVFLEESRRHLIFHKVLYDFNAITTGYRATVSWLLFFYNDNCCIISASNHKTYHIHLLLRELRKASKNLGLIPLTIRAKSAKIIH